MRYLGQLSGEGMVSCDGHESGRASFEFDGFGTPDHRNSIVSSGEIRLPAPALSAAFGRGRVNLLTDDGRHLILSFSEKVLHEGALGAHVDVTGDLPGTPELWRQGRRR
jgi:hypothetical protein